MGASRPLLSSAATVVAAMPDGASAGALDAPVGASADAAAYVRPLPPLRSRLHQSVLLQASTPRVVLRRKGIVHARALHCMEVDALVAAFSDLSLQDYGVACVQSEMDKMVAAFAALRIDDTTVVHGTGFLDDSLDVVALARAFAALAIPV